MWYAPFESSIRSTHVNSNTSILKAEILHLDTFGQMNVGIICSAETIWVYLCPLFHANDEAADCTGNDGGGGDDDHGSLWLDSRWTMDDERWMADVVYINARALLGAPAKSTRTTVSSKSCYIQQLTVVPSTHRMMMNEGDILELLINFRETSCLTPTEGWFK